MEGARVFFYLLSPYSKYPGGAEEAYRLACEQTALLMSKGLIVVSPIAHGHGISFHGGIGGDYATWERHAEALMRACVAGIFLKAPSWEESVGMAKERRFLVARGKAVVDMEVGAVPTALVDGTWPWAHGRGPHHSGD